MSFKIRTDASGNGQFTIDSTDVLSINTNTTVSLPTGTANGVAYLNGSKVLTSGSALTFDGTNLGTGGITFADASTQSTGGYTGFRNRIINGDMRVVQRTLPYTATSGSNYGVDRFNLNISGADGSATVSRGTMVHGGRTKYTCKFTVVTPPTNLTGVNRWEGITQYIEGFNFQDLVGKPLSVSFLFRSNVTGKHSIRLGNGDGGYLTSFTYSTANAIQYVSVTLPAMPDMVNFGNSQADNGNYMRVQIDYYNAGSLVSAETSNWNLGVGYTASGAANWTAAAGNYIELTELQVEAGTVATPFEFRPYGTELALCQRYYQTIHVNGQPVNLYPGISAYTQNSFPVEMRAAPSVVFDNTFPNSALVHWGNVSTAVTYALNVGTTSKSISWQCLRTSGVWASTDWCGHTYVNIKLSAEL